MPDKITPALTPEEWAILAKLSDEGNQQFRLRDDSVEIYRIPLIREESRHAVAALCLHGQPFGFTREDVKLLGEVGQNEWLQPDDMWERVRSLSARISALLPPEGT